MSPIPPAPQGVTPLIYCSTEAEASFAGHAVNDMLRVTNAWLDQPEAFAKEAASRVGLSDIDGGGGPIDHATLTQWCRGVHVQLTRTVLAALDSREFIEVRCALIFLSKCVANFPSRVQGGREIQERVAAIEAREKSRVDLQLMARSLGGNALKKVRRGKAAVPVLAFAVSKAVDVSFF